MNILFISAVFPYPLNSGGQVRIYNLLNLLSQKHTITLYSYIREKKEENFIKQLSFVHKIQLFYRGRVWQPKYLFRSLVSSHSLLSSSYENDAMKQSIGEELQTSSYDLVHIEPFYVYPALPSDLQIPLVVSEHNIEYEVYGAYAESFPIPGIKTILSYDVGKIKVSEEKIWEKAHAVTVVSEHDKEVVKRKKEDGRVDIVSNGVDTAYHTFREKTFDKHTPTFLFVGNFRWLPNMKGVDYLLNTLWPEIQRAIPKAKLTVVGKYLDKRLQQKAKETFVTYNPHVGDIREAYRKNDILLSPMSVSGGTKFKILEAMANGCLVITSKEGIEGIGASPNKHFYMAENKKEYIDAITLVYKDPKKSKQIVRDARLFIEKSYDWKSIAEKLSNIWEGIL